MEHTEALLFPSFLRDHSDRPTDHGDGDGHMVSNMVIWLVGHMVSHSWWKSIEKVGASWDLNKIAW